MTGFGFIISYDVSDHPLGVGDHVDSYRLLEPLVVGVRPHAEHDATLTAYIESVAPDLPDDSKWRHERTIYCSRCPKGASRPLVAIFVHNATARRWVAPQHPERGLGGVASRPAEAWPLHGKPGETPCYEGGVTTCPGCRSHWLMLSTHDDVLLRRVAIGRHEGEIVE